MNRFIVSGNLTQDPETVQEGLVKLSVAENSRRKVNGEWQDWPNYFNVTTFGNTANFCGQYLTKGSHVVVEGRVQQDRWEDPQGNKRSALNVVADRVESQKAAQPAMAGSNGTQKAPWE